MKPGRCILLLAVVGSVLAAFTQQTTGNPAQQGRELRPLEHPITEEQLRTYFRVCHFESISRQLTHEKMEQQRKQLPEWYPQPVWDEIEGAIDNIDLPKVALPAYQRHIGQEDARWLIRFFATPQGQNLVQSVFTKDAQAQRSGAAPLQARKQTMAALERNEAEEVRRVMAGMSPDDLRDLAAHAAYLQQMQLLLAQMRTEVAQATLDKQTELMKAIMAKHEGELADAQSKYEASHRPNSGGDAPQ